MKIETFDHCGNEITLLICKVFGVWGVGYLIHGDEWGLGNPQVFYLGQKTEKGRKVAEFGWDEFDIALTLAQELDAYAGDDIFKSKDVWLRFFLPDGSRR